MGILFSAAAGLLSIIAAVQTQSIPMEIWGKWVVARYIPTTTVSCWGEAEAKLLLGTEIEYSAEMFRWRDVIIKHPVATRTIVTAEDFERANSGGGANGSRINFAQLGINAKQATGIYIEHPASDITGGSIGIPGDGVLIKDANTIVFSVCNLYFEAKRATVPLPFEAKPR